MSFPTATWRALGTRAQVVVTDPAMLDVARLVVGDELAVIDRACSRFRADGELARVHGAGGVAVPIDSVLGAAIRVALRAARETDGLVDPTIGEAMVAAGYDRDFAALPLDARPGRTRAAPGWRRVALSCGGRMLRLPPGAVLDLGSTGKAWAADRCAAAVARAAPGCGALVSLGGDIAVSGRCPAGGWPVGIADGHEDRAVTTLAIAAGGLATSSTTQRRWRCEGRAMHHILDPRTGEPAPEVWRTVSVAAPSCVAANTASTAAIVLGEAAPAWLAERGLPARLVAGDGTVTVTGGWPREPVAA